MTAVRRDVRWWSKLKVGQTTMTESAHNAHAQDFTPPNKQLTVEMTSMQYKLREMSSYIQQLKNALQSSHARLFQNEHPLLDEGLLRVKEASVPA